MDMQTPSSSSSSSSFSYRFSYDVFLSFRGTDTRFGFTGYLYKALCDKGIRTFMDDDELQQGEEIAPSLVKAIEDSRIFIPVFSINYASSSFCLDELVNIIHCFKTKGRLVLPVFYGVEPSSVRHQTDSYGEAIAKHKVKFRKNKEKYRNYKERLHKWMVALNKAANLSGYHINPGTEYEYKSIGEIVNEVSNKISRAPLYVADYPVGLKSRLLKVISFLDVGSNDVVMVGLHGIGGMGKTTFAREIYNFIADQFEALCFLHNVREKSTKHGLEHLQELLLSKTVGMHIKLGDVNEGIPIIKHRLNRKKVLLILDDVDKLEQLQGLAGGLDWFGLGSRVIITTRDKKLLSSHGIKRTYEVDKLNEKEAFELLRWNAFKNNMVDSSYEHILKRAVSYASGLPLALEIVGSNLFGEPIEEWESTLDRYKMIPPKKIQMLLKVSFDGLEEDEQSVFLDIACCFKGYELAEVKDILCAHHGYRINHQIRVLVDKSLIKISPRRHVTLHDLIEGMGKEIVRQKSPNELGKRSRLWFHEDVVKVLQDNLGTSQIEIIHLDFPLFEDVIEWKGDELKKMENLRTLIIKNGRFSKGPERLPNSLRVLEWPGYPSQDIPSDFCARELSICRLPASGLISFAFHGSLKAFLNLRELNVSYCRGLRHIFDISGLQNLETFSFRHCENLITIHKSVGFLNKLKILDAEGCSKLKSFPPLKLTSLQQLELSFCKSLERFPEILGEMENIDKIVLKGTSIGDLPFSFQNLTGLSKLEIWGNGMFLFPSIILTMPNLSNVYARSCQLMPNQNSGVSSKVQQLQLINCDLPDEFFPTLVTWFSNIKYLSLLGSEFTVLPECLKECRSLSTLNLNCCKHVREIRGIPPSLKQISALRCESLTSSSRSMLLNQELHEAGSSYIRMAGTARVPEWFEHQSMGPSISFWFRKKIPSIVLIVVSQLMPYMPTYPYSGFVSLRAILFVNGDKYFLENRNGDFHIIEQGHTYLYDLKLQDRHLDNSLRNNEWNHVEVTFEDEIAEALLIESGIHVFKHEGSMEDIRFTHPF